MRQFFAITLSIVSIALSAPSHAAELVMFEQAGCVWCMRWNREIGPAYPNTDEAKIAPLRRVDIHAPLPEDLAGIRVERFTPTFVLVDDGEEIGRMRGYTGDEFFWFLLGEMLDKLESRGAE
ncbi:transcriptional regulator [Oricola sp.]|uniref:transcriptional regulator n=1 Tax=Oricola sp. TaxID=1979950 RepID=UPI0025EF7F65|nr:transcriptional regulator [Oricola sp.]MCI5076544.1 transcriptional regulator [Oricola sp.]